MMLLRSPETICLRSILNTRLISSDSESLLRHYTVTPPIKPWPRRLYPKRLISMIVQQQNIDLALQMFLYAGKFHPGFSHNYDTYHSIIFKLSRARAFEPVEPLLADLWNSDPAIKCGENLFIDLLRNYGLAGRPESAMKTFLRIPDFGVQRSVRSLNTLLNVLIQNKRFDLVHAVFKSSKEKFNITPNIFTCNLLVKALCKKNDIEGAYKVLDEIPAMGLVPNLVTYTTILGGYVARGDMVSAKRVLREILDRGWEPDATTYTVLMDGYCKLGRFSDAAKVMDEMEENEIEPNEVTYGVMIEGLCKEKKSGEACDMFDEMLEKGFMPSSSLSCKVIDVLCEDRKVDEACRLWRKMLKKDCMPDNNIVSTLVHWLCKEGHVWEARKLFDEFEKGSIPSLLAYNTLIAGMCEKGDLTEASRLWDDMVDKKCEPNAFTYNVLIKGLCKSGNAREGIRVLEEMLDKGCFPNKQTFCTLFEGLRGVGKHEDEVKVVSMAVLSGKIDKEIWEFFMLRFCGELDNGVSVLVKEVLDFGNFIHNTVV
ncbi:PREDICTED: pentatricopeptide repeat-containing protein At5g16420, mitochondrial [Tarenaya hassleriana]|uniref:pentatricopeptide repeat-containing protein At5g16420, mitochondrial n=1 Tax=Tarenaya hassleriana TaxID=28532 RepID=UPI00053C4599|nr:PREDICTED: pentatricopeptide repeat-containing protein At5g16420, mitochondrial [Tarenaya hassleriana]XP_010519286.1 PREDICTED: pentatricopeptide repeat-containing protein At5g16420, mitochondrial [Tarenaya hassleriana]